MISIKKHMMAIFIEISAMLKIGKLIGTISKKSRTYPLKSLSIPFPIVPPSRNAIPMQFQYDFGGEINTIVINNNETKILIIVRSVVELIKRLNAAPLFFTRLKSNKLGIMALDLLNPNVFNTVNLLI